MQAVQPKYGRGMTLAACLWLGLFPLLQGGSYARITRDKWIAMLVLTALTFLCFLYDFFHGNTHSLFFRKGADGAGAGSRIKGTPASAASCAARSTVGIGVSSWQTTTSAF